MTQIGELIKNELERQERSITWFAKKLNIDRSNAYRMFKKNSIDTEMLLKISIVLHKDFFRYLSEEYESRQNMQQI